MPTRLICTRTSLGRRSGDGRSSSAMSPGLRQTIAFIPVIADFQAELSREATLNWSRSQPLSGHTIEKAEPRRIYPDSNRFVLGDLEALVHLHDTLPGSQPACDQGLVPCQVAREYASAEVPGIRRNDRRVFRTKAEHDVPVRTMAIRRDCHAACGAERPIGNFAGQHAHRRGSNEAGNNEVRRIFVDKPRWGDLLDNTPVH